MPGKKNRNRGAAKKTTALTDESFSIYEMARTKRSQTITDEQARNFLEHLRYYLVEHFGSNQAEMGRVIGRKGIGAHAISGQALSQQLSGKHKPGWPTVSGLAAYLGVDAATLLAPFHGSILNRPFPVGGTRRRAHVPLHVEGPHLDMAHLLVLENAIENARYPHLEAALRFYGYEQPRKWSDGVVSAARSGYFEAKGCGKWTPPEWVPQLNALETILQEHAASIPDAERDAPPESVRMTPHGATPKLLGDGKQKGRGKGPSKS